ISDADISCAFWRRPVLREGVFAFVIEYASQRMYLSDFYSWIAARALCPAKAAPHCIQRSLRGQAAGCKASSSHEICFLGIYWPPAFVSAGRVLGAMPA